MGLLAGCAPKQVVYLPPDWKSPSPAPEAVVRPSEIPAAPKAPPSVGGPIFEPPSTIREMELQPTPETSLKPVEETVEAATPQHYASMHLVDQAKLSLNQGRVDEAIGLYEQAVQVDVYNGEAFLGLAKAWHMKGSQKKSLEFARKAEILLQDKPSRLKEVYLLQADIHRQLGEIPQAEASLRKASRL